MRKIESLQDRESIEIKTKKEANKVGKLVNIAISTLTFPSYVIKENNGYWVSQMPSDCMHKLPASEFIKKSKTKQRLKALEARMDKIDDRFEPTTKVKYKPKLEVLPEKWCVKIDRKEVVDYCNKHGKVPPYAISNTYAHFPTDTSWTTSCSIDSGYTLISFDDFKRLVLDQPKEIDFSVAGQLVQDRFGNLVLTTGSHSHNEFSGTILAGTDTDHSHGWIKSYFIRSDKPFTINPKP